MDGKDKQLSSDISRESSATEQEEPLEYLVLEAQRHIPGSKEQNDGITRLISELEKPGRLSKPRSKYNLSHDLYHQVYEEKRQNLHLKLVEEIQAKKYDPEKGTVINWAGFYRDKKFKDAQKDSLNLDYVQEKGRKIRIKILSGDTHVITCQSGDNNELGLSYLELIPDKTFYENVNPLQSQELVKYIKEDPQCIFSKVCIPNYPRANFRHIFLLLHSGYNWNEIANSLNLKLKTVTSRYYRWIKKLKPVFKEYLQP